MGQKVNPISNRLGIIRGWDSNWYGGKNYGDALLEDSKIRKYLNARLAKASVSRIVIERTLKLVTITVCTARPGIIIGKGGQEVDKLKEELKKITDKDIQINIFEVKRPELDAVIVANNIARQVEGKIAYRRAIKMAIANTMRMGAEGIKVLISGRLNGAEMARSEMYKEGRTPLHTFRADIDYCHAEALTKVGLLGIKVWICRGEVYGKREFTILLTIPLAVVGAILLFFITGTTFNMMGVIGIVMLGGIAVNNSIILVDRINQLSQAGMELTDAIVEAGQQRIRPIIMTTLTTILAMLPMTFGFGEGASLRSPMAIAVIGGLITSTLMSLMVIPCVYYVLEKIKRRINHRTKKS